MVSPDISSPGAGDLPAAASRIRWRLAQAHAAVSKSHTEGVTGRVIGVDGTVVRASAIGLRMGEICSLRSDELPAAVQAEVVGFSRSEALLSPFGYVTGLNASVCVVPSGKILHVPVGPALLGRVLDGFGQPLDQAQRGPMAVEQWRPVDADSPDPLARPLLSEVFVTGVRAIDAVLSCAVGQRLGIFAAAGTGKSSLLSMLVKGASADVVVVALIGERGREVREFLDTSLQEDQKDRTVVVCATSDKSPLERLKAAYTATTIAEYFRDQGRHVLLLMDSVTRFARAQRELGLAAGEPPARRGFPPSVFAQLPKLMERAGANHRGAISAFYTVLVEGDDMTEPVADEVRSILDGHIILSRKLAEQNHYPAIDVLASVSRVMGRIVDAAHLQAAGKLRALLARYQEVELLLRVGEYKRGSDPQTDLAVARRDEIVNFLRQDFQTVVPWPQSVAGLQKVGA
ncbi:MAG: type III secretion system ATPase SctN [Burkholderiaceae bacterium]|nr:type III secretion system ATPase SctN [Burkholderiaceae bacterium]